jgi:ketosteroid isomerase-like protein
MGNAERNVESVKSMYAAFNRGDVPSVLARLDPKVEWTVPASLPFGGTFRGPDGVGRFFQGLPGHFPELRVEADAFVASGDDVVARGHHRGKGKSGAAFEVPWAMAWTFRDGKVVRFVEYQDTAKTLQVIGR